MAETHDLNLIATAALGGVFGYQAGFQAGHQQATAQFLSQAQEIAVARSWQPFIQGVQGRWSQIVTQRIIKPLPAFDAVPNLRRIYGEAATAYLYGLSSSAVFGVGRLLDVSLTTKYQTVTNQAKSMTLDALIDWCQTLSPKNKNLASSCRLLRNTIHTDEAVDEPDVLTAIRNSSTVLNELFPFTLGLYRVDQQCQSCKSVYPFIVSSNDMYVGNTVVTMCSQCKVSTQLTIYQT